MAVLVIVPVAAAGMSTTMVTVALAPRCRPRPQCWRRRLGIDLVTRGGALLGEWGDLHAVLARRFRLTLAGQVKVRSGPTATGKLSSPEFVSPVM